MITRSVRKIYPFCYMHGHVTGSFVGGSREDFQGDDKHNKLSQCIDLAELNPNCHMNYNSIIFKEISFCPETSILLCTCSSGYVYLTAGVRPVTHIPALAQHRCV